MKEVVYGDAVYQSYVNRFPGWAHTIRHVIQKNNPNRASEIDDVVSFGLERPMTLEEAELMMKTSDKARRPALRVVC
jgi:hypothetical protein